MASRLAAVAIVVLGVCSRTGFGASPAPAASTCGSLKTAYKAASCCGMPTKSSKFQVVPMPGKPLFSEAKNYCHNKKPASKTPKPTGSKTGDYFANTNCTLESGVLDALEQSATNVTLGYKGEIDTTGRAPITTSYLEAGLCPVNVHWHLGTEHYSVGEYTDKGMGPKMDYVEDDGSGRRLGQARLGGRCHKYNANDAKFTTKYQWHHCKDMHVGETYEVHWPHSGAGACGTPYQYQTPFYDGVFCRDGIVSLDPLNTFSKIGVQGQIFTIVNDEAYYYPELIRGAIVDGEMWKHVTKYTGSTTGTSRNNVICSRFTPITWQVDRKCHLISASSFDKMCADMKNMAADMTNDLHPHGSRELVISKMAADNHQRL